MDKNKWMSKILKADAKDKFSTIVSMCENKNVLDVGCIGQDKAIDNPKWLHGRLKKVSKTLIGVDINTAEFQRMEEMGFKVVEPVTLENSTLKFDLIIMGDVIEHVNDPSSFLTFYAQFLAENGKIVICTPNSFGIRYFIQVLFYGTSGTNEEHTFSFEPYTMLELFSRVNLIPADFYWLKEYEKPTMFKRKFVHFLASLMIKFRKYFYPNFMFVVQKQN